MVGLITVEPSERIERIVPMAFAHAQLGCGYSKVTIYDVETGIVIFQESN